MKRASSALAAPPLKDGGDAACAAGPNAWLRPEAPRGATQGKGAAGCRPQQPRQPRACAGAGAR